MNKLILVSSLALFAINAHASSVTVVEGELLQPHLDGTADTLYLPTWTFEEDVVIRRPIVILPAPHFRTVSIPQIRSLKVDGAIWPSSPGNIGGEICGARILGPVTITTNGGLIQRFTGCRMDKGLREIGSGSTNGLLAVNYCTIFGDVFLRHGSFDIALTTVIGGGIDAFDHDVLGVASVRSSHVQDAAGTAIAILADPNDALVSNSTVARSAHGIDLRKGGRVLDNVVTDVAGDGYHDSVRGYGYVVHIERNRFERCGVGIQATAGGASGGALIDGNVILNSVGDGIVAGNGFFVFATRNSVALSGGNGISGGSSFTVANNAVAFNGGAGISGGDQHCNGVWMNGVDARMSDNIHADPMFCDLNAGDVRVSVLSPYLNGSCGQIGALGAGCGNLPALAMESAPPAEFGIRLRGRVALVTVASDQPAALDVLDVAGRRLSRTTLTTSREVAIDQPAGVYFLRLTQGVRSSSAKAVVMP